jgi:PEP-CTERM motif-containing protein
MKKILLALIACLAITGISFADFSLGHDPGVDVGNGLTSYQVYIMGTSSTGGLASAIDSVNVISTPDPSDPNKPCSVVQFSMGSQFSPTVLDTDITNNMGADQSYLALDTHLITPAAGWVSIVGGATETNDASISTIAGGPWFAPQILGVGPITSASSDAYGFETQAGDVYIMQVVLQEGATADVSLQAFGADMNGNACSITIPVPEPSTIVMLVLGALCLLIRRK